MHNLKVCHTSSLTWVDQTEEVLHFAFMVAVDEGLGEFVEKFKDLSVVKAARFCSVNAVVDLIKGCKVV